eukprot:s3606_g4.t1
MADTLLLFPRPGLQLLPLLLALAVLPTCAWNPTTLTRQRHQQPYHHQKEVLLVFVLFVVDVAEATKAVEVVEATATAATVAKPYFLKA